MLESSATRLEVPLIQLYMVARHHLPLDVVLYLYRRSEPMR